MRTSNPALRDEFFTGAAVSGTERMTIRGTVNKTLFLLFLVVGGASFTWMKVFSGDVNSVPIWMGAGAILGFILAMVTIFKREWAGVTAPAYALAEGVFIGGISAFFEARYPGIALQSVALTFGTLLTMLGVYRSGLITVTDKFRMGVVAATGGVALLYLASWILGMFGVDLGFMQGSGALSIGLSFFVVGLAALNLVLDFDFIERASAYGLPKYMEWYGAFSLMVTLVWLYLEILRLMSKLNDRRR